MIQGRIIGVTKGDTRSFDYGSHSEQLSISDVSTVHLAWA